MPPTDTIPAGSANTTPLIPPVTQPDSLPYNVYSAYINAQNQVNQDNSAINTVQNDVNNLMSQLSGQQGDYNTQLANSGYNTFNKELSDLNALQTQQQAGYLSSLNRQNTGAVSIQERSVGEQAVSRQHGIDALLTNSLIQAKSGQINQALDTVKSAIDAKYEPIRAQLEAKKFVLDQLTTKAAEDRKNLLDLQMKQIEKVSDFQKTILNNAISAGASQSVLSNITKANSIEDVLKAGQGYLANPKEQLELAKLGFELNKSKTEYATALQALENSKNFLGGSSGDVGSDLILGSAQYNGKQPSASWIDDYTQAGVTLGNVQTLQDLISKEGSTGLISGNVKSLLGKVSGKFANAASINKQLQATVPGLARGIFKEVGVLTDADIANYKKVLPNLKSPEQQNKLALLMVYDVIERSMSLSLVNQAKAKNDVSGYYQDYFNVKNQVAQLKSELGYVEPTKISPQNNAKLEASWNASLSPASITSTLDNFFK